MLYRWLYNRDFATLGFGAALFPEADLETQRAAGTYAGLGEDERNGVDAWFETLGGLAAFQTPIPQRLECRDNRLMPAG